MVLGVGEEMVLKNNAGLFGSPPDIPEFEVAPVFEIPPFDASKGPKVGNAMDGLNSVDGALEDEVPG